jgi:hypothetical protein
MSSECDSCHHQQIPGCAGSDVIDVHKSEPTGKQTVRVVSGGGEWISDTNGGKHNPVKRIVRFRPDLKESAGMRL